MTLSPFVNALGFVALPPKKIGAPLRGTPIFFRGMPIAVGGRLHVVAIYSSFQQLLIVMAEKTFIDAILFVVNLNVI